VTETLDGYLRAFAHGDATCDAVATVVARLAEAAISLAELAAQGTLAGPMAAVLGRNGGRDEQKALDLVAHELFLSALKDTPVAALASEEADEAIGITDGGPLVVAIDPLDGSKNIDVNATIGSIFAARRPTMVAPGPAARLRLAGRRLHRAWPADHAGAHAGNRRERVHPRSR
jgi:fructose-1,6-bisphosphatase I